MNRFKEILSKAGEGNGLCPEEAQFLLGAEGREPWEAIYERARELTQRFFGRKMHFYVPLYFSSSCINDCAYCGFRRSNVSLRRLRLTAKEFIQEAAYLWFEGHRDLLLVAGEHPILAGADRVSALISELMREGLDFRVAVEVGPLDEAGYGILRQMGVCQCVLYQETYDREVYDRLHVGEKKDFEWRYHAMLRARMGGIPEVGLGFLLGLSSVQGDLAGLISHALFLRAESGTLPATLSFPRLRSASGIPVFEEGFVPVSDEELERVIAVARLALPSVGIKLSTRERPGLRDRLLDLGIGVTHISAGVSVAPGGYTLKTPLLEEGQFSICDERSLSEMTHVVLEKGYKPVFSSDEGVENPLKNMLY